MNKNTVSGFTVIELMVTLAIIVIVMQFGVYNMKDLILRNQMTNYVNNFVTMQHLARQTAIFRQSLVTLCASNDGQICLAKKYWHEGMLIFIDYNGNQKIDNQDIIVKFHKSEVKTMRMTWRAFQNKSYLQFTSNGWTNSQNGTFRFCFDDEATTYNRALIVNRSGRLRLSTDQDNNGIHEDASGDEITC